MKIHYRKTVKFVFFLCLVAVTVQARADDATKRTKIQELFRVMRIDRSMSQLMDQAANQGAQNAMAMFPKVTLTDKQQKALDEGLSRIRAITQEGLSWTKLSSGFTDLYAATYSEETIDGLLAFYKSPAGTELLEKQPQILAQSAVIVQKAMQDVQPRLRQAMADLMNDPDLKPASPAQK